MFFPCPPSLPLVKTPLINHLHKDHPPLPNAGCVPRELDLGQTVPGTVTAEDQHILKSVSFVYNTMQSDDEMIIIVAVVI